MANIKKLKALMIEKGVSMDDLADYLKINRSTLYRRMSDDGVTFTIEEAQGIYDYLDMTPEVGHAIFFANEVV